VRFDLEKDRERQDRERQDRARECILELAFERGVIRAFVVWDATV
jgi:hypothetical protein